VLLGVRLASQNLLSLTSTAIAYMIKVLLLDFTVVFSVVVLFCFPGTACSEHNSNDENRNILLHASTGRIVTPQFTNSFSNPIDCTWKITLPLNNGINMSFHSFIPIKQATCSAAALEVYNGRFGRGHGTQLGMFCVRSPLPVIYSTGRYLSLRWRAKDPVGAIHFGMDFRSIQQSKIRIMNFLFEFVLMYYI
jgi:hypothetical protein